MASANSSIPGRQSERAVAEGSNRQGREAEVAAVRPNRAIGVAVAEEEEADHNPEAVAEEAELHLFYFFVFFYYYY